MEQVKKGEQARKRFESGCNCAQAVFSSFCEETGLSEETALLLTSPFGGGVARTRETCGAVTGMLMVMGLINGYSPYTDKATHAQEKARVYQQGQELIRQFTAEFGSPLCRELIKAEGKDSSPTPSPRTDGYYKRRSCADYVAFAAELTEAYIKDNKK